MAKIHVSVRLVHKSFLHQQNSELRGLASKVPPKTSLRDAFPWLHSGIIFSLERPLTAHLDCSRIPVKLSQWVAIFHINFYEIIGPTNSTEICKKMWKAGPLHSDRRQYWHRKEWNQFCLYDHEDVESDHSRLRYKTAVRYLRESSLTVSDQAHTYCSC
jgi:hypothetical protein